KVDHRTIVRVGGAATGDARRTDRDYVVTTGRGVVGGVAVAVAGCHHHRGTQCHRLVDCRLADRRAAAAPAQAEVDDLGRCSVVGDAGDGAAGGPDDRVGNVGGVAAALAQHADRQDLRVVRNAGHADAVVGQFGHGTRHVGAVERAARTHRLAALAIVVPVTVVVGARD